MADEREEQTHRLRNRDKSDSAKLAWKRHHSSYMTGTRKREREDMSKTFYQICKELDEANISQDNVFDNELKISFDNMAGGVAVTINKENGNVSLSTTLEQSGSGQYRLKNFDDATLKQLYQDFKEEFKQLCDNFDEGIEQILAKHGLNSTK